MLGPTQRGRVSLIWSTEIRSTSKIELEEEEEEAEEEEEGRRRKRRGKKQEARSEEQEQNREQKKEQVEWQLREQAGRKTTAARRGESIGLETG
ncbi:hypothetical protein TKK_0008930 [Trichogramma kaykai]